MIRAFVLLVDILAVSVAIRECLNAATRTSTATPQLWSVKQGHLHSTFERKHLVHHDNRIRRTPQQRGSPLRSKPPPRPSLAVLHGLALAAATEPAHKQHPAHRNLDENAQSNAAAGAEAPLIEGNAASTLAANWLSVSTTPAQLMRACICIAPCKNQSAAEGGEMLLPEDHGSLAAHWLPPTTRFHLEQRAHRQAVNRPP